MKKLSIITINLNNQSGLIKTINSVINQNFTDFEWIVIDGGSTDGSKKLIEQYAQYITYWISEPDKGIYNAMNKGIKIAKGEYCLFLNSGDYLASKYTLKRVFNHNYTADIILGNILFDVFPVERGLGFHCDYITCFDLIKGSIAHQASFIKKELFDKYGYYDEDLKIAADWKFFLYTIVEKECSVKYINEDIAYYDINGISSKQLSRSKEEKNKVLLNYLPRSVINDYKFTIQQSEIRKYYVSRLLYSLLYRSVMIYERIKFKRKKYKYKERL